MKNSLGCIAEMPPERHRTYLEGVFFEKQWLGSAFGKYALILPLMIALSGCGQFMYGTYRLTHGETTVDLQTLRAARISISKAAMGVTGECEILTIEPGGVDVINSLLPVLESAL